MSSDGLHVPCPKCGEKTYVTLRKRETRKKIKHLCIGCGARFTLDLEEMREIIRKQA